MQPHSDHDARPGAHDHHHDDTAATDHDGMDHQAMKHPEGRHLHGAGRFSVLARDGAPEPNLVQIAIVLYPGLTALDAIGPYEVLRLLPDTEVRFVGAEPGPVVADSGVLFLGATHSYAETPHPDVVLVPGSGPRTATMMADTRLTDWLRKVHQTTRWTTSVCTGAMILAAAGILDGLPTTTHWMVQPGLGAMGAKPRRGERIVHTGKVATAAGVSAGIDLGLWLAGEIAGRERAETIQLYIEYDPHPPFDAGSPSKASKTVVDSASKLGRKIALNPSEIRAVPAIAWRRALGTFRKRRGLP